MCIMLMFRSTKKSILLSTTINPQKTDKTLSVKLRLIFNDNYQAYGARRLQVVLRKQDLLLSRRRIARIMKEKEVVTKIYL
ncbi:IS3 family transposase [Candidatus Schmidhempelia bombi]|uniref:Transposase n=1 Tax=Candidatus Schmidhempelia bombi str. Bimp TaxID=1387197 RepID=A0AB94IC18_9GAMM|nr:transposase [Candidatus Schmidhempelia bombi str. Bimp]